MVKSCSRAACAVGSEEEPLSNGSFIRAQIAVAPAVAVGQSRLRALAEGCEGVREHVALMIMMACVLVCAALLMDAGCSCWVLMEAVVQHTFPNVNAVLAYIARQCWPGDAIAFVFTKGRTGGLSTECLALC